MSRFVTRIGEAYPALAAFDELRAELRFQILKLLRQGRLGHRTLLGGTAEMQVARQALEIAQLFQGDHR